MYIKSYSCKRFAGIQDKNIDFEKGLNVILGPNESGKSTIIDGIHSTLFKNIKLKKNNNSDTNFTHRFMPKPNGDSIDGNILISINGQEYNLNKEWGNNPKIEFLSPDNKLIKNEDNINDELKELLLFGEGTYTNIVFAKQRDLKAAIANLVGNKEVTNEINSLLRNAIMELDGISLDQLEQEIEFELLELLKRWDLEKNYPENNRGINNPYKTGVGKILESFYKKEDFKLQMDNANKSETKFEAICSLIKDNENKTIELKSRKEELEKIEGDVNSRTLIESELKFIEKELEELSSVNKEWPRSNLLLEQYEDQAGTIIINKENLIKEKENYKLFLQRKELKEKLEKIEIKKKKIEDIQQDIEKIPNISKDDIESISSLEKEILKVETTMSAGVMIGKLTKLDLNGDIYITKDLDEKKTLQLDTEFRANGFIKIDFEDKFQLEIKTGELDFDDLKNSYDNFKEEHNKILESLKIKTLEEGKLNRERIERLRLELASLNKEVEMYLGELTLEQLIETINELEGVVDSRDIGEIDNNLKLLEGQEFKLAIDKQTLQNNINKWIEKYTDEDNLLDILLEARVKLNEKKKIMENLVPLPEEFSDGEDFKNTLIDIKYSYDMGTVRQMELKTAYYEAQNHLLDISYEELKVLYDQTLVEFNKNLARANSLLKIKKVFLETKEDLASDPMESLVKEFSRVLSLITNGDYNLGQIDENFEIKLESQSRGTMDIDILSAGTYDAVTLALRFSILKHIYGDRNGYVCLDDCLVDLDPMRKQQSVNLIQDFAKDNQVIFTTCDPLTAELLGGNIIRL